MLNEEKIKAFFSDDEKVKALINDEKFIDSVSGGKQLPKHIKMNLKNSASSLAMKKQKEF